MTNIVFGSLFILFVMVVFMVCAVIVGGRILGAMLGGVGRMLGLIPDRPQSRMLPHAMRGPMPPQPMRVFNPPPVQPVQWAQGHAPCQIPGCRHINPVSARFCRHCGHAFPVGHQQPRQQLPNIWT